LAPIYQYTVEVYVQIVCEEEAANSMRDAAQNGPIQLVGLSNRLEGLELEQATTPVAREALVRFFEAKNPENIKNVDAILQRHKDDPAGLRDGLKNKYGTDLQDYEEDPYDEVVERNITITEEDTGEGNSVPRSLLAKITCAIASNLVQLAVLGLLLGFVLPFFYVGAYIFTVGVAAVACTVGSALLIFGKILDPDEQYTLVFGRREEERQRRREEIEHRRGGKRKEMEGALRKATGDRCAVGDRVRLTPFPSTRTAECRGAPDEGRVGKITAEEKDGRPFNVFYDGQSNYYSEHEVVREGDYEGLAAVFEEIDNIWADGGKEEEERLEEETWEEERLEEERRCLNRYGRWVERQMGGANGRGFGFAVWLLHFLVCGACFLAGGLAFFVTIGPVPGHLLYKEQGMSLKRWSIEWVVFRAVAWPAAFVFWWLTAASWLFLPCFPFVLLTYEWPRLGEKTLELWQDDPESAGRMLFGLMAWFYAWTLQVGIIWLLLVFFRGDNLDLAGGERKMMESCSGDFEGLKKRRLQNAMLRERVDRFRSMSIAKCVSNAHAQTSSLTSKEKTRKEAGERATAEWMQDTIVCSDSALRKWAQYEASWEENQYNEKIRKIWRENSDTIRKATGGRCAVGDRVRLTPFPSTRTHGCLGAPDEGRVGKITADHKDDQPFKVVYDGQTVNHWYSEHEVVREGDYEGLAAVFEEINRSIDTSTAHTSSDREEIFDPLSSFYVNSETKKPKNLLDFIWRGESLLDEEKRLADLIKKRNILHTTLLHPTQVPRLPSSTGGIMILPPCFWREIETDQVFAAWKEQNTAGCVVGDRVRLTPLSTTRTDGCLGTRDQGQVGKITADDKDNLRLAVVYDGQTKHYREDEVVREGDYEGMTAVFEEIQEIIDNTERLISVPLCQKGHLMSGPSKYTSGWCCSNAKKYGGVGCASGLTDPHQANEIMQFQCRACNHDLCIRCVYLNAKLVPAGREPAEKAFIEIQKAIEEAEQAIYFRKVGTISKEAMDHRKEEVDEIAALIRRSNSVTLGSNGRSLSVAKSQRKTNRMRSRVVVDGDDFSAMHADGEQVIRHASFTKSNRNRFTLVSLVVEWLQFGAFTFATPQLHFPEAVRKYFFMPVFSIFRLEIPFMDADAVFKIGFMLMLGMLLLVCAYMVIATSYRVTGHEEFKELQERVENNGFGSIDPPPPALLPVKEDLEDEKYIRDEKDLLSATRYRVLRPVTAAWKAKTGTLRRCAVGDRVRLTPHATTRRDKCLGAPGYGRVGEITDYDRDRNGRTFKVVYDGQTGWYCEHEVVREGDYEGMAVVFEEMKVVIFEKLVADIRLQQLKPEMRPGYKRPLDFIGKVAYFLTVGWATFRGKTLDHFLLDFTDDVNGQENLLLMAEFVFSTLFMSLIAAVVRAVECVYPEDRSTAPYLRSMATMACWEDEHKRFAVSSLSFMVVFLLTGPMVSFFVAHIYRTDDALKKRVVQDELIIPTPLNSLVEKIGKVLIVLSSTHLAPRFPWAHLTSLLCISLGLTALTFIHPSSNYHVMHELRLLMYLSTVSVNICSMVSKHLNDETIWWPIIMLGFLHLIYFAIHRQQQRREAKAQLRRLKHKANAEGYAVAAKVIAKFLQRRESVSLNTAQKSMFERHLGRYEGVRHFKKKVAKGRIIISELLCYIPFMILLVLVTLYARAPPSQNAYLLAQASQALMLDSDGRLAQVGSPKPVYMEQCTAPPVPAFSEIQDHDELWAWVKGPMLDGLLGQFAEGKEACCTNNVPYQHGYNKLVGRARIRQLRGNYYEKGASAECRPPLKFTAGVHGCYTSLGLDAENQAKQFRSASLDGFSTEAFQWQSSNQLNGHESWTTGQLGDIVSNSYPGDGYAVLLPGNLTAAMLLIKQLEAQQWIDYQTRVLFLEFNLFNPNLNLLTSFRAMAEFPLGGGIVTSHALYMSPVRGVTGNWNYITEILFVIAGVLLTLKLLHTISVTGSSFFVFWRYGSPPKDGQHPDAQYFTFHDGASSRDSVFSCKECDFEHDMHHHFRLEGKVRRVSSVSTAFNAVRSTVGSLSMHKEPTQSEKEKDGKTKALKKGVKKQAYVDKGKWKCKVCDKINDDTANVDCPICGRAKGTPCPHTTWKGRTMKETQKFVQERFEQNLMVNSCVRVGWWDVLPSPIFNAPVDIRHDKSSFLSPVKGVHHDQWQCSSCGDVREGVWKKYLERRERKAASDGTYQQSGVRRPRFRWMTDAVWNYFDVALVFLFWCIFHIRNESLKFFNRVDAFDQILGQDEYIDFQYFLGREYMSVVLMSVSISNSRTCSWRSLA
jgi:hypothetical protein